MILEETARYLKIGDSTPKHLPILVESVHFLLAFGMDGGFGWNRQASHAFLKTSLPKHQDSRPDPTALVTRPDPTALVRRNFYTLYRMR